MGTQASTASAAGCSPGCRTCARMDKSWFTISRPRTTSTRLLPVFLYEPTDPSRRRHPTDRSIREVTLEQEQNLAVPSPNQADDVLIIGAGPAGLTAAFQLAKAGKSAMVLEADSVVGGISRSAERDGWRFDIGGHRFFTKVKPVDDLWHEILGSEEFLRRSRMS